MITQDTAAKIWNCYREIEACKKLQADLKEAGKFGEAQTLKDVFGRGRNLELGIPSGDNSHRILQLRPKLAEIIIHAHIKEVESDLIAMNELARHEIDGPEPEPEKEQGE